MGKHLCQQQPALDVQMLDQFLRGLTLGGSPLLQLRRILFILIGQRSKRCALHGITPFRIGTQLLGIAEEFLCMLAQRPRPGKSREALFDLVLQIDRCPGVLHDRAFC